MKLPIALGAFAFAVYVLSENSTVAYTIEPQYFEEPTCRYGPTEWTDGHCVEGVCYQTRQDCAAQSLDDVVRMSPGEGCAPTS